MTLQGFFFKHIFRIGMFPEGTDVNFPKMMMISTMVLGWLGCGREGIKGFNDEVTYSN